MLKFERMTEEDYHLIGKEVQDGVARSDNVYSEATLVSNAIFGDTASFTPGKISVARDHLRGYIRLCKPVINIALAQRNGTMIARILGKNPDLVSDVVNCGVCYDTIAKAYVHPAEVQDSSKALWGAEIVQMWIREFDLSTEIKYSLWSILGDYCKSKKYPVGGEISHGGSDGYVIAGDWRYNPPGDYDCSDLPEYVGTEVFRTGTSRLTYLLNLQGHVDRLEAFTTSYIAVTPINMRPPIANRQDHLTWAYSDVIAANKNLRLLLSGSYDAVAYGHSYRALCSKVDQLLALETPGKQERKSVMMRLKGKTGHIRDKMLGKRVDYAGRSVITIDPYLSLRKVRIPREMIPKLYQSHLFESMSNPIASNWLGAKWEDKAVARLQSEGILEHVPAVIGRQPTLHKPSMRAFQVELTDERSIRVNPLCVTGFNADFDGDQMWVRVPVSQGAVAEVKGLMGIEQNLYYPKNGECSVMPRQEILYGLNVCTRKDMPVGSSKKSYSDRAVLLADIYNQDIKVSDTVTYLGHTACAGHLAFASCLSPAVWERFGIREITSKTIPEYIEAELELSHESAIDVIDRLVELGFKICYLYPPTLNMLDDADTSYEADMEKFHASIQEIGVLYERGLEEQAAYDAAYEQQFMLVEDRVKSTIYDRVGRESGFVRLAESGARGSKSNLTQMYGYKGRIQKSSRESFKAVIEHSYSEQLTPIEHFVTAYGGRQGLINKSLNTADTGYASRKMWHATSPYVIASDDCGTTEGIEIRKSDIAMFNGSREETDHIFKHIITGRYQAGTNRFISKEVAEELCATSSVVTIRSVITCKAPCCKKCYGHDPSTHRPAAMGLPIGFIAAQSIGEPGTQLSMDSFKKGGVASKAGTTSAFDKLEAYIECKDISQDKSYSSYDPVAWASGHVIERFNTDGTKTVRIEGDRHSIKLPSTAVLREDAVKGEGLCVERGDYNMKELIEYAGVYPAQLYLIHTLYHIYKDEGEICMQHFEVLAAAMTMHMVVSTDRDDLVVGQYHDTIQMYQGDLSNTIYTTTMLGVKRVQSARPHALSRILLENVQRGLADAYLLGLEDPLEYPLNRIMLGQQVYCGGTDEFLDERKI